MKSTKTIKTHIRLMLAIKPLSRSAKKPQTGIAAINSSLVRDRPGIPSARLWIAVTVAVFMLSIISIAPNRTARVYAITPEDVQYCMSNYNGKPGSNATGPATNYGRHNCGEICHIAGTGNTVFSRQFVCIDPNAQQGSQLNPGIEQNRGSTSTNPTPANSGQPIPGAADARIADRNATAQNPAQAIQDAAGNAANAGGEAAKNAGYVPVTPTTTNFQGEEVCAGGKATECIFQKYINPAVRVLGVIAGIAAVGGLIWGGILYIMSKGDQGQVVRAKRTITQALIGLAAFFVLVPMLSFLNPSVAGGGDCRTGRQFMGFKSPYYYLPAGDFEGDCSLKDTVKILPDDDSGGALPLVALAIVDDLVRLAGLLAVVFVIVGGVKYMTSTGDPGKAKQAIQTIVYALAGLIIAIFAAAIVAFIGRRVG